MVKVALSNLDWCIETNKTMSARAFFPSKRSKNGIVRGIPTVRFKNTHDYSSLHCEDICSLGCLSGRDLPSKPYSIIDWLLADGSADINLYDRMDDISRFCFIPASYLICVSDPPIRAVARHNVRC